LSPDKGLFFRPDSKIFFCFVKIFFILQARKPLELAEMNPSTDLKTLAEQLLAAKESEHAARAARQLIEDKIVALTGLKDYGQKTVPIPGAKVIVKPNFSYSLDKEAWDAIAPTFPQSLLPYRVKREPNESRIRTIKQNHPDLYARLATALTMKPIRPTVEIELIA
jgi:hypothetical protein